MKLFTVVDETNIGTHRTVPVSFVTNCKSYTIDCKSDMANCKFCQNLQLARVAINTIWSTITRWGDWNQTQYTPGGVENRNFWFCVPPGGRTGGQNVSPGHLVSSTVLGHWSKILFEDFTPPKTLNSSVFVSRFDWGILSRIILDQLSGSCKICEYIIIYPFLIPNEGVLLSSGKSWIRHCTWWDCIQWRSKGR